MGEANRRNIHQQALKYAEDCNIVYDTALRRVKAFAKARQQIRAASKCPGCNRHTLFIESTDYEFQSNESWVQCSECDKTFDISTRYKALHSWFNFDVVMAIQIEKDKPWLGDWDEFALNDTIELEKELKIRGGARNE